MLNSGKKGAFLVFALFLISGQALGADAGPIQSLQDEFIAQTSSWFAPLKDIATWLLISLATISWAWSAGQMVLRNADLQEFVVEIVRMVIFVGFFLALILNADTWTEATINGFMWAGDQAAGAGISRDMNPAGIMERGLIIGAEIVEASGWETYIIFGLLGLVAVVIYALIASYALLVMGEMYIVTAAGVLLLGFGGSQWTTEYAKRYMTYCLSVGAKLYVLFLIIGLGENFIYNWAKGEEKDGIADVIAIVGILVMLVVLVKMLPDLIQSVINGSSLSGPSPGAMMAGAAGAAVGATAGAVGGAMAVKEASKLAGEQLGGQGGGLSSAASLASPGSGPAGNSSFLGVPTGGAQSSSSGNAGPMPMPGDGGKSSSFGGKLSQTMQKAKAAAGPKMAHAAQTAKNLNKAAGETVGGRIMGDYNSTHGSFGGSMAQKLRAERLGMTDGSSHPGAAPAAQQSGGSMTGSIGPGAVNAMQEGASDNAQEANPASPDFGDAGAATDSSAATGSATTPKQQQGSDVEATSTGDSSQARPYHSPAGKE